MAIISNKDEYLRKCYFADVKNTAKQKIIALIPGANEENYIEKEMNMLMRSNELLNKKIDGSISQDELNEIEENKALANQINAIRAASNMIENEIINNITYNYKETNIWP